MCNCTCRAIVYIIHRFCQIRSIGWLYMDWVLYFSKGIFNKHKHWKVNGSLSTWLLFATIHVFLLQIHLFGDNIYLEICILLRSTCDTLLAHIKLSCPTAHTPWISLVYLHYHDSQSKSLQPAPSWPRTKLSWLECWCSDLEISWEPVMIGH